MHPTLRLTGLLLLATAAAGLSCRPSSDDRVFHARLDLGRPHAGGELGQLPELRFAAPIVIDNLTLWPVVAWEPVALGRYPSLVDAQQLGEAEIREYGGGTVSTIEIRNRGKDPLLVCAGTLVKGGKQDRQIGKDLVIGPDEVFQTPAYCVERDRWQELRAGRETGGSFECLGYLATKRVRASAQYDADQEQVWRQVDHVNQKAGVAPETGSFVATVEDLRAQLRRLEMERRLSLELEAAAAAEEVVGFAYAVNGEPLAARVFASEAVFAAHAVPFLKTMVLEAEVADRGEAPFREAAELRHVLSMIERIDRAAWSSPEAGGDFRRRVKLSRRGGHSRIEVPRLLDSGERVWLVLTEDWTAVATPDPEMKLELYDELCALGYTES